MMRSTRLSTWLLCTILLTGCATMHCPGVTAAMREPINTWERVAVWSPPGVGVAVALLAVPMLVVAIPIACRAEHARAQRAAETPVAATEQPVDTAGEPR